MAVANETLYIDDEGFAGYGVKKGNPVCKCSTLDDVLIIDNAGVLKIVRIQDKFFAGKNPLYISVIKKGDDPVFNLIYRDGKDGPVYAKRFRIGGFTRDKEYPLTRGAKGTRIFHFSVHETEENSSQISVNVYLKAVLKLRNLIRPFHFADLRIKTAVPREISLPGILWNASPASCLRPSPEMRKRKGQQPLLPQQRNGRKAHPPPPRKRCILKQPHIWRNRLPIRRWNRAPCLTPETFSIS